MLEHAGSGLASLLLSSFIIVFEFHLYAGSSQATVEVHVEKQW